MMRRSELDYRVIEEEVENECSPLLYLNVLSGIKTGNKIFILTRIFLLNDISALNYCNN
jgi:hypothetical protein